MIVDSGTSEVSSLPSISPNDNPPTDQHEIVPDALVPKAGRPVGTTNEKKREDAEKHKRCVNSIAYAYSTQVTVSKASKTRCPKGFLLVAGLLEFALGVGAGEESDEDDDPMGPDGEEDMA